MSTAFTIALLVAALALMVVDVVAPEPVERVAGNALRRLRASLRRSRNGAHR